ncbi:MAG: 5-formyltetrahydrofolate cyclo-ligase [Planctomycetota bacterium]|jgi:5-formyltetrahydrofolate cyclo-ligase
MGEYLEDSIPFDDSSAAVDVAAAKAGLRREIKGRIAAMTPEERAEASSLLAERVRALPEFAAARRVLLYSALPDEADVGALMDDLIGRGREVLLPVSDTATREIKVVSVADPARELRDGAYGILEPLGGMPLEDPGAIDFIIVPGRAFDSDGRRLGRGKGYYDGFLSRLAPFGSGGPMKLGVAFSCQLADAVPTEPRDVNMDAVATERRVIRPT